MTLRRSGPIRPASSPARGGVRRRTIAEGPPPLVLREGDGLVELMSANVVLLSSAALGTERAFGRLALLPGRTRRGPLRVVVGGLGFGATARGVLEVAGPEARVTVVEKVAAVAHLVRGELAHVGGAPLDDSRLQIVVTDVVDWLARAPQAELDAVLLDVDNGPHWASFRTNSRIYSRAGLATIRRALAPGGHLAVWSGYRSDSFLADLRAAGFAPSVVPLHEEGRVRARAYVGARPS
jgi:spermidine synthase